MQVQTLWQSDHHSAFTDLIYFNQAWYCVFREGSTHMSYDGQIIVLTSKDAKNWQEHSRLNWQGGDLRDPKLSVSPANQLVMTAGIRWAVYSTQASQLYSVGWLLNEHHQDWSLPVLDETSEGTWRWATTWHKGLAFSVGYSGLDKQGCLYQSEDGLHWQAWVKPFFPDSAIFSNETSLVSDGETLWCLTRRDATGGAKAIIGRADHSCQKWHWQTLPISIGGPKLIKLSNGEWVMAVRRINFKRWTAKTCLYKLNPKTAKVKLWRTLPSGGDTSYAGMVEQDGRLYISYYSSHRDNQTHIYLADIPLVTKKRSTHYC
ncbi:hypothetical protein JX580_02065 [Thiomicrospira microaerophila]|uniref:hypothetical protein n=1 Tax=Thiomicrospira microaerophila TaxID=406020 RepID=UPI00200F60C1|nr:hypothetical protein [Thiomicrospira microaerophila]UQB42704.1 hypothetical protein JX580_02065 [Thiomicrospira microaerophila]